ncbi:MAG: HEAT repeat domain-containing protein [Planctomycetota bacterium]
MPVSVRTSHIITSLLLLPFFVFSLSAGEKAAAKNTDDPDALLKGLKPAKGFSVQLWTANKMVINPVSISFDDQNRLYVCETFRFRDGGGLDVREHKYLYYDDILLKTTDDRRALYAKYKDKFKPGYFTTAKEKIVLVEDTQKSGKADKVSVFAEAFNDELDGPGVGVCWHDGKLYFACVPKIWELTGANGTGPAEKINTFFDGFGVRVSISGHDLHGTIIGPDGKLYWSMGDRGFNATGREGQHFANPHTGGVFRANLDGSDLEQIYYGLRNPQELAFDEFGNLFTVDNNADIGDSARLTYILDGGDTGWHMGLQMLGNRDFPKLAGLGEGKRLNPWLDEGMWKLRSDTQPANILPPIGHITSGPSGLAYTPGTGLPDSYARHFFVCDYTSGSNSGVYSFVAEESGAGFEMKDKDKFLWGITATDVAFGYDGRVYVCDYGGGWHLPGKGSIVALSEPDAIKKPIVEEVRKLFADGIAKLDTKSLAGLLKHVDMRVRQRAQFELAKRAKDGLAALTTAAQTPGHTLSRIHGIWGLGQLHKQEPEALKVLVDLLNDTDARVREHAAKTLGDTRFTPAVEPLKKLLTDPNSRVKTFAAIALGKLHCNSDVPALLTILRDNADKDAFLRHAAVMGLAGTGEAAALLPSITDSSRSIRLGVLLALRRMQNPNIAAFLKDADPQIYAEAVRAIYDTPIRDAMPQLAADLKRIVAKPDDFKSLSPLLFSRLVNANYRYGTLEDAAAVAEFAATPAFPENVRIAALDMLTKWEQPTVVDPVMGLPRPVPARAKLIPDAAIKSALQKILSENGAIAAKAVDMAVTFGVELTDPMLLAFVKDAKRGEDIRTASLEKLASKKYADLTPLLPALITDPSTKVRVAAIAAQLDIDGPAGIKSARAILGNGTPPPTNDIKIVTDRTTGDWNKLKMGAPSNSDFADKASAKNVVFSAVKGFAPPNALAGAKDGLLPRLNDGAAAENADDTERNTWLDGNGSRILCDLQKTLDIGAINTFSWHAKNRAHQHINLWGSNNEKADAAAKDLKKEWTLIAAIDTTKLGEGGKHGSAVYNAGGSIGKFRYLLWESPQKGPGTFFSEIDVYETGTWQFSPQGDSHLQQDIYALLGKTSAPAAADYLVELLDHMAAGKIPASLHLDLIEAAELRKEESIIKRMADLRKAFPEEDKVAPYRMTLTGGDAKLGEDVFKFHAAGCLKCHKIGGEGHEAGSDAGPKLAGVATRLTRDKILESLIDPSAVIVPGFGTTTFRMKDGLVISGSVIEENTTEISVKDAEGKTLKINVADIKKRAQPVSPMPPMGPVMKPREIRDLIEYLSTLK